MIKFVTILFIITLFFLASCSKQEACYCNIGEGEYEYVPLSTNAQNAGTISASGDLEQECDLQDEHLKTIHGSKAYCEMK
jgi:hypothetical protein